MKHLRLVDTYYYLPVLLLGLLASPNIVGWRIGLTVIVSLALSLPAANLISVRLKKLRGAKYSFRWLDIALPLLLISIIWLSIEISYYYLLAQLLFVMFYVLLGVWFTNSLYKVFFSLLVGAIFFSTIYLGFNQYDYKMLFRKELLEFILLASCLFAFLNSLVVDLTRVRDFPSSNSLRQVNNQLGVLIRLTYLMFIILLWRYYPSLYSVMFLVVQLPVIYSYILLQKSIKLKAIGTPGIKIKVYRQIAVLCFNIFLIYLFLDSTQVLQAVKGGY